MITQRFTDRLRLKDRLLERYKEYSIRRAHKVHRRQSPEEYKEILAVISKFRTNGGLRHEFQAYKLFELQKYLRMFRPTRILELGSGSSTFILANYAKKYGARVVSIDESDKWIKNTKALLGSDLSKLVTIKHSKRKLGFDGEITLVNYDIELEDSFDFVLVDGPSQRINGLRRKDSVNANVVSLFPNVRNVLVDARYATFDFLSERGGDDYDCMASDLISQKGIKSGYHYFSVLKKKEPKVLV